MSDTVKLIIEIPKEMYEALLKTERIISSQRCGKTLMNVIYFSVANGTPLDEVKAKMEERHDIHDLGELKSRSNVGIMMFGVDAYNRGIKHAIEILDRIGKESEDT